MAVALSTHIPIRPVKTISGNAEQTLNPLEGSGGTWQPGTPVQYATSGGNKGYTIASTPSNGSTQVVIAGVSNLAGQNLGSAGAGASPAFGSIGYPGGAGAVQNVQGQPAAYSIYGGAPFVNGLTNMAVANLDTIFEIQVDASSGTTYNYSATAIPLGSTIALNVDSNGWWYADLYHVNAASYNDATIVGYNPADLTAGSTTSQVNNGRIWIVFNTAAIQGLE